MNENIDLTKILKDCPNGWEFYSGVHGDVKFIKLLDLNKILFSFKDGKHYFDIVFPSDGKLYKNGECIVFPSKDQRDWSKFTAPWLKKERFDPKTLSPFDRVLARNHGSHRWACDLFSNIIVGDECMYHCINSYYRYCIPYNDDTKHLLDTKEEAPVFYRYWED